MLFLTKVYNDDCIQKICITLLYLKVFKVYHCIWAFVDNMNNGDFTIYWLLINVSIHISYIYRCNICKDHLSFLHATGTERRPVVLLDFTDLYLIYKEKSLIHWIFVTMCSGYSLINFLFCYPFRQNSNLSCFCIHTVLIFLVL